MSIINTAIHHGQLNQLQELLYSYADKNVSTNDKYDFCYLNIMDGIDFDSLYMDRVAEIKSYTAQLNLIAHALHNITTKNSRVVVQCNDIWLTEIETQLKQDNDLTPPDYDDIINAVKSHIALLTSTRINDNIKFRVINDNTRNLSVSHDIFETDDIVIVIQQPDGNTLTTQHIIGWYDRFSFDPTIETGKTMNLSVDNVKDINNIFVFDHPSIPLENSHIGLPHRITQIFINNGWHLNSVIINSSNPNSNLLFFSESGVTQSYANGDWLDTGYYVKLFDDIRLQDLIRHNTPKRGRVLTTHVDDSIVSDIVSKIRGKSYTVHTLENIQEYIERA